jgi:hypothetical protein
VYVATGFSDFIYGVSGFQGRLVVDDVGFGYRDGCWYASYRG